MPRYCCVPRCSNSGGHRFPKRKDLRQKWRVAIRRQDPRTKRLWEPSDDDLVCHNHFTTDDYYCTLTGDRSRLRRDAIPSLFPVLSEKSSSERSERSEQRNKRKAEEPSLEDVQYEVEVNDHSCTMESETVKEEDHEEMKAASKEVQCNLPCSVKYGIEMFRYEPSAVSYYTGFNDYAHFMIFFLCLGPCVYELDYKCSLLEPKDQLFLTLMKLRQAKEDFELSMFFQISKSTISRLFTTWINFLYFQLKELDIWPSREVTQAFMPNNFAAKFPTTRVILDATEVPIEKPSDVNSQSATWSSYKHKNTIKAMIGCTPKGAVSYVSDAYAGSVSDRQIIERSELLSPGMFECGDSIMADRGIMVQDLFANHNVHVNTPTLLKGKSQLDPEEVVHDRRVASKRIHIERIIGLTKGYKILKCELSHSKLNLGSRIIFVCFAISNFRNCIVKKDA